MTFENKGRKTRAHIEEARLREIINKGAMNLPTMVISIGGQARTGKSFLLNLFITYLSYIEQVSHHERRKKQAGGKHTYCTYCISDTRTVILLQMKD